MREPGDARRRVATLLVAALAGGGCTAAYDGADAHFEAGDYRAAAEAYEASLSAAGADGQPGPRCGELELRLALVYTLPDSPVHRPERAAELLGGLAGRCPESPWGDAARMLLGERQENLRLHAELAVERARVDALEERVDRLSDDRATADDRRAAGAASEAALSRELVSLHRQVQDLTQQLEARDRRLTELENELRRLKAIDLKE